LIVPALVPAKAARETSLDLEKRRHAEMEGFVR